MNYGTESEYKFRLEQFKIADEKINRINSDPELTFVASHNKFSTLTKAEFKRILGKKPT